MAKNFSQFSEEEKLALLIELQRLIDKHALQNQIQALNVDQIAFSLKAGKSVRRQMLVAEGKITEMRKWKDFESELHSKILSQIKSESKQDPGFIVNIEAKLSAGDLFQPIDDVIDVITGDEDPIRHNPGQVIMLDFWASWCGPCQGPMSHNEKILAKNSSHWADRVRIIGISLDKSPEIAAKHAKKQGWSRVEMMHIGASQVSQVDYGIQGIPHIILVGTDGKIAFSGHPQERRDLEGDINKLLQEEKLIDVAVNRSSIKAQNDPAFKTLDLSSINEEMTRFKKEAETFLNSRGLFKSGSSSKQLERDLFALIKESKFSKDGDLVTKYQNITILSGPKKAVEDTKSAIDSFNKYFKGNYEVHEKIQSLPSFDHKL